MKELDILREIALKHENAWLPKHINFLLLNIRYTSKLYMFPI